MVYFDLRWVTHSGTGAPSPTLETGCIPCKVVGVGFPDLLPDFLPVLIQNR